MDKYIDCTLWAGCVSGNGYSYVSIKNDKTGKWTTGVLHRQLYLVEKGDIPDGFVLDHLCRNRICINTDHLEAVTNTENLNRGNRPSVYGTHCNNGHELAIFGYTVNSKGSKQCRECRRNYFKSRNKVG